MQHLETAHSVLMFTTQLVHAALHQHDSRGKRYSFTELHCSCLGDSSDLSI